MFNVPRDGKAREGASFVGAENPKAPETPARELSRLLRDWSPYRRCLALRADSGRLKGIVEIEVFLGVDV